MSAKITFGGILATALAASPLFGGLNEWKGASGDWSAPGMWNKGHAPEKGEDTIIYASVAGTTNVVCLSEDMTNALLRIRMRPQIGKGVILDGNGYTICFPDLESTESVYPTTPLAFGNPYNYDMANGVFSAAVPGYAYKGTFRFVDPRIEMTEDADGTVHTRFTRGTYDFWSPNGTELPDSVYRVGLSSSGVTKWHMRFSGAGTKAVFPKVELLNQAHENVLEFAGGDYAIMKDFASNGATYDMAAGEGAVHTVRVTDGATLSIAGATRLYLDSQRASSNPNAKYSWNFEVLNGATLNTTNAFYAYRSTNGVVRIENATWNAPGNGVGGNLAVGIGYAADDYYSATTQKMVAVNATLNFGTAHNTGNFIVGRVASGKRTEGSLFATNCTINAKAIFQFSAGSSVLKDCTFVGSGNTDYAIVVNEDGELTLDGGTYTKPGGPRLSFGANAKRGPILTFANGTLTTSQINMSSGGSDMSADCAKTNVLRVTGGTLTATYTFMCGVAQPCHVIVEGGTYDVMNTTDNGGKSHWRQPTQGGWAHFTGNGGTVLVSGVATYQRRRGLLEYLDRCEAGPKGLNVDTNGKNPFMLQDVTDMPGEEGRFVKRGTGTLTVNIPSLWDVSETIVEAGTLLVGTNGVSTAVTMQTALALGAGTELSLAGDATSLTVDSLALTNTTLVLDPGDVVTVKESVALGPFTVRFTSTPTKDQLEAFLRVECPLTDEDIIRLKTIRFDNEMPSGTAGVVSFVTDAKGQTTVSVTVQDKPTVTGETTWKGPGADWLTAGNWTAGVPAGTDTAVFAGATPNSVNVSAPTEVGALSFGGGDYTVAGSRLLTMAAYDKAEITVTDGDQTLAVPTLLMSTVAADVAADASLTVSGKASGGGFKKTGHGVLTLAAGNDFTQTVESRGGRLVAAHPAALGGSSSSRVVLGDGTLEVPEGCGQTAGFDMNATNKKTSVVLNNAADVTMRSFATYNGALIKRGKGTLTIDTRNYGCKNLAAGIGHHASDGMLAGVDRDIFAFPEDGTPPANGYGGFNVAGGEVVVKGDGTNGTAVSCIGAIHVGLRTSTDCGAQPTLTFDNVYVNANTVNSYQHLTIGWEVGMAGCFTTNATVRANGSKLEFFSVMMGYPYDSIPSASGRLAFAATNSFVWSYGAIGFSQLRRVGGCARLLAFNSTLRADYFDLSGNTDSRLTASRLSASDGGYGRIAGDTYGRGTVLFDGGTLLKVDRFEFNSYVAASAKTTTFAFDDATWDFGDKDYTLTSTAAGMIPLRRFEMRGEGLKLPVAAGRTLTTDYPFVGTGKLQLTGSGTLRFNPGSYQLTGPLCALAGTVDLSQAGTVTNACFGAGDGVISGATVKDPVFRLDAGAPNLANCALTGVGSLYVGEEPLTKPYPTNLTVLRFTGTAPNVSHWRLTGAGKKGLGGTFTVQDGEVKVSIEERGFAIVIW